MLWAHVLIFYTRQGQGPAQDVHFYTHALISWQQKGVSNFSQHLKNIKFHIEIADDKFKFLNCVIGQKYLKNILLLFL